MEGPFDVWVMYLRLKLHFQGTMGYFDYSGTVKSLTRDAYLVRKDRKFFERMFELYGSDSDRFMLSCFVGLKHQVSELYIYTMLDDTHYEKMWRRFQKVEGSLIEAFRTDLIALLRNDTEHSLKHAIRTEDTRLPLILRRALRYDFGIESYVILNTVVPVNELYLKDYELDPRVGRLCSVAEMYKGFIRIPCELVRKTIKEVCLIES